jgi:hypothetical protein
VLPNFLLIGAPKAGTTSLWHHLGQHPDIHMSATKEPNHFSPLGGWRVDDRATYEALFAGTAARIRGEASVAYLSDPASPGLLARHVPDARLVAVLRDPVARALSQYRFNRSRGWEPRRTFAGALREERRRRPSLLLIRWYAERGRYGSQLDRYARWLDEGRLRVFLYEDLLADRERVVRDIFAFLGVDADVPLDLAVRHNATLPRGMPWLGRVHEIEQPGHLKSRVPLATRRAVARRIEGAIRRWPPGTTRATIELREELAPDVERLEARIGRDLSAWLPRSAAERGT